MMRCEQLDHLLTSDGGAETSDENTELIIDHGCPCPPCQQSRTRLAQAVIANETLSGDQCH